MLGGLGAWLCLRPSSRRARTLFLAATSFFALSSIYGVSHPIGKLLSGRYHPLTKADLPSGRTAIVLLGSGIYTARGWDGVRYSVPERTTAPRILEALRLYRMSEFAWIVSSGGNLRPDMPVEAAGVTMRNELVELGVPPERIQVETESRTTHEEAEVVKAMLPSLQVDHIVLVTTELHMRRSVGTFRAAGIEVIPAIAPEPIQVDDQWQRLIPSEAGFSESKALCHELVGILYYRVRGWYQ